MGSAAAHPPLRPVRVLAVDDEPALLRVVQRTLEAEGLEVAVAGSGETALEWISRNGLPHIAVVDVLMPGMDGLELCRRLQETSDVPVILLTGVDDERTVVRALEQVAEDYVTKPFRPKELAARVKRVLRRFGEHRYSFEPTTVIDAHLSLNLAHRQVVVDGDEVSLTPIETKLLHILVRSSPRTITTRYLIDRVWPLEEVFEDTLRVHVHRLRSKIEPEVGRPRYLLTKRGAGYAFVPPSG